MNDIIPETRLYSAFCLTCITITESKSETYIVSVVRSDTAKNTGINEWRRNADSIYFCRFRVCCLRYCGSLFWLKFCPCENVRNRGWNVLSVVLLSFDFLVHNSTYFSPCGSLLIGSCVWPFGA